MQGKHYRAIFISDVHLGTSACQAEFLLSFLQHNTADTLYLVGDIIDLIAMRKRVVFTPAHEAVVAHIIERARSGHTVIYIPGNHDAFVRRFAGQNVAGIDIQLNAVHETLKGQRYFISHGDEFDTVMRYSGWLTKLGDLSHGVLLRMNTFVNKIRKSRRLPYWSLARAVKQQLGSAKQFITQFEKLAALQAREQAYDGYICGHIHHWQMCVHHGVLYINDGDWVEHCTALVETEEGTFELLHWSDYYQVLARSSDIHYPESELTSKRRWLPVHPV